MGISRSSFYYEAKGESLLNLELMQLIDKQFLETPFMAPARWRDTCAIMKDIMSVVSVSGI
ncbi:hypothetical protein MAIT1_04456 [Magnetofaba australis IT-1]|uniref:Uncharacterized protein n=1 Tax=Magnetofaba australis IT-1 TaxID=1434232 RepID=A0A1Y2K9B0_9PROT|nr:hypothetical protein MAIT1_04456 [Magnetofaba australis IT-1]